jgi:hypothetical protein
VKRLLALLAGALGLRAVLRRRPAPEPALAEDLRAKLAQSRTIEADRADFEGGETPVDEVPDVDADVDSRRADVHARARRAIDELGNDS